MLTFAVVCLLFVGSGRASGESGKAWGVYQIYWQPFQFEQQLDEQLASLGGQCKYTLYFRDLSPKRDSRSPRWRFAAKGALRP